MNNSPTPATYFHECEAMPAPARPGESAWTVDHWTCCQDENLALCGTDVSAMTEVDEMGVICVVCDDLMENTPQFCPRRTFCPFYVVPA